MSMLDPTFYGVIPAVQKTGSAGPQPAPEATAPAAQTKPAGRLPLLHQAGFWLVALIAVAAGLVHLSIRWS